MEGGGARGGGGRVARGGDVMGVGGARVNNAGPMGNTQTSAADGKREQGVERSGRAALVALETTLLAHGVPKGEGMPLAKRLAGVVRARGAEPAVIGVVDGEVKTRMSDAELERLLHAAGESKDAVRKLNTSNLGAALFRKTHGATTVATTMELAARAGIQVFATGGLGGVHWPHNTMDVSADLAAFTRFPVCVVASGVKSILDVAGTREMLETLGVPVVGFGTDEFPTFYLRKHPTARVNACDARFDDAEELAAFVRFEMARTNRGVLVVNPIPVEHEIAAEKWLAWLAEAEGRVRAMGASGRDATPALLGALHSVSGGATLRANVELVVNNADLAARIAVGVAR